jgi:hypothetical protein
VSREYVLTLDSKYATQDPTGRLVERVRSLSFAPR